MFERLKHLSNADTLLIGIAAVMLVMSLAFWYLQSGFLALEPELLRSYASSSEK